MKVSLKKLKSIGWKRDVAKKPRKTVAKKPCTGLSLEGPLAVVYGLLCPNSERLLCLIQGKFLPLLTTKS